MYDERFMKRAIALSERALTEPGTEPFGAVIVRDGEIVGEGLNRARARFDPTSHGEVEAIRDACSRLQCLDLRGCELYTSCEPCALCVATMSVVGISRLYYAASMEDAGTAFAGLTRAQRHPVDPDALRAEAGAPVEQRALPAEQHGAPQAAAILDAWGARLRASSGPQDGQA
ncbi:nucleoside deaminase [Methylobacterium organophilum]|uniref:Guanine deaminase n=1 Tax=Methylobacterium organophilum TaxID=410 RepID=A0ABQ4T841_METOR|nr:nucleoside deaminase [Methylobacterium organophilum]GJE27840.1 Guanine deaminase [Methylobacterium organophilum]